MCVFFGHNQNSNIVFPLLLPRQLFRPCFLHSFSFHYCFRFHEAFVFFFFFSFSLRVSLFLLASPSVSVFFVSVARIISILCIPLAHSTFFVRCNSFNFYSLDVFSFFPTSVKMFAFFRFNFVVSHNLFVSFHLVCCSIYYSFIWLPLCTRLLVFGLVQFM